MNATTGKLQWQRSVWTAFLLLCSGLSVKSAHGQAAPTATRPMGFDVFGGVSEMKLDVGGDYNKYSTGFTVGGDLIRHFPLFDFMIEPRFGRTSAKTQDDSQDYFLGDFAISRAFGRFHPYGIGGIGYGVIHYAQNGGQDNSIVYAVGPGLQYNVTSHWALKGDWQYQWWSVGTETNGFNPHGFTIAVVYRLHFGSF